MKLILTILITFIFSLNLSVTMAGSVSDARKAYHNSRNDYYKELKRTPKAQRKYKKKQIAARTIKPAAAKYQEERNGLMNKLLGFFGVTHKIKKDVEDQYPQDAKKAKSSEGGTNLELGDGGDLDKKVKVGGSGKSRSRSKIVIDRKQFQNEIRYPSSQPPKKKKLDR